MPVEVILISNGIFPEAALPDGGLSSIQPQFVPDFSRSNLV